MILSAPTGGRPTPDLDLMNDAAATWREKVLMQVSILVEVRKLDDRVGCSLSLLFLFVSFDHLTVHALHMNTGYRGSAAGTLGPAIMHLRTCPLVSIHDRG